MKETIFQKKPRLLVLFLLLAAFVLILRENLTRRPATVELTTAGQVEMCLACHKDEKLDPAHDPATIGCSPCHLGDAMAYDKEAAHQGIVINPGDLRLVERTCGTVGCHGPDVHRVKNTLMATNRGIIATMRYYWGESETQNGDFSVEELMASGENSFALDYYRKLCATCHLWKQRGDFEGVFGEKGGGCTSCHNMSPAGGPVVGVPGEEGRGKQPHPHITRRVVTDNCVRCHNRSGRIGLAYMGRFESDGYGTPYENGGLSSKRLPDGRFYQELADDVHHRAGMACIDCHTRNEVMGDGTSYAHYEDQLEILCSSCHAGEPGVTRKGNPLPQVVAEDGKYVQQLKLAEKKLPLLPPKAGACDYPLHQRLSCEACHSAWVPQCYGCHVKEDRSDTHLDKLTMKDTDGWWEEGKTSMRYEEPALAVWGKEIVVVTPGCQDVVTRLDAEGRPQGAFNRFTMAAINPHTTQKESRSCASCHASTKTVGLGQGVLWIEEGRMRFAPTLQGIDTVAGSTVPMDGFVSIDGAPRQHMARADLRPFDKRELYRILRVGLCLPCHESYQDPAFVGYSLEKKCTVYREPAVSAEWLAAQEETKNGGAEPAPVNERTKP